MSVGLFRDSGALKEDDQLSPRNECDDTFCCLAEDCSLVSAAGVGTGAAAGAETGTGTGTGTGTAAVVGMVIVMFSGFCFLAVFCSCWTPVKKLPTIIWFITHYQKKS
ncbi:hypothetical protein HanIR_Chr07g0304351 [Helianthus annuus]|nr:hypothetical protein HanIR_Chr07g0304351 [Helianthus annuus]